VSRLDVFSETWYFLLLFFIGIGVGTLLQRGTDKEKLGALQERLLEEARQSEPFYA